jgi:hypothetical protein
MMFQLSKDFLKVKKEEPQNQSPTKTATQKQPQKQTSARDNSQEIKEILKWKEENAQKISKVLDILKQNLNGVLVPQIDHGKGLVQYPVLNEIQESNLTFLEKISHKKIRLLEKFVYNQFLICPIHKSSFLHNVRLCCPKCNSIDIHKLHLFEHKICGCIAEKPRFENGQEDGALKCPSCNRIIKTPQKELRVPASWYLCSDCKEKFDDIVITIHCKEADHDFAVSDAQMVTVYGYTLANADGQNQLDYPKLKSEINKVLTKFGFSVDEDYSVKGKSGHDHTIDVCGTNKKNQNVFILFNGTDESGSEIGAKIIQVLDTAPKIAIIIGHSSINEKTRAVAAKYNVSIISSQNISEIASEAEKIISFSLKKLEGVPPK